MQKTASGFKAEVSHCPHCGVYAEQEWFDVARGRLQETGVSHYEGFVAGLYLSFCLRCGEYALWRGDEMIYPVTSTAPLPVEGMPTGVKEDFLEGRAVFNVSPRGAASLLRLALQKLMVHLGENGKNLDEDIANLTRKGLPKKIQEALSAVRAIGNDAAHPGEIDSQDSTYTATALFDLLNMIVDVMLAHPKKVNELYRKLPDTKRKSAKKRKKKQTRRKRKKRQKEAKWNPILYR
jgi:hypothetical protein